MGQQRGKKRDMPKGALVELHRWQRRHQAARAAVQHAEAGAPGFLGIASEFVVTYLLEHGSTSESDLMAAASRHGTVPDVQMVPYILSRLSRHGRIMRRVKEGRRVWELRWKV